MRGTCAGHSCISNLVPASHQRHVLLTEQRILVSGCDNFELLGCRVVTKPAPARALDSSGRCVQLFLERYNGDVIVNEFGVRATGDIHTVKTAKVGLNGILEGASGKIAAALRCRREVLPEKGVVDVSCSDPLSAHTYLRI